MSATGLDVFDRTLHKTNLWLNDLMQEVGSDNRHEAYRLAKRISEGEIDDVQHVLPAELRNLWP